MDSARKAVLVSLIITAAVAWLLSLNQPNMMTAMTTYNPLLISLFTASWTAGMAAMMFPAITPMVMLYSSFVSNSAKSGQESLTVQDGPNLRSPSALPSSSPVRSLRVALFIGGYLLVWALTGVALLVGWSLAMNSTIMSSSNTLAVQSTYGSLLVIAGVYQFTPLKRKCIGYCESPMSFFARRWRDGTTGAVRMGLWHGLYCLGCCWSYFLLMVALGWMNVLWMGLFAGIIFGEKIWSKGLWVARAAGIGLAAVGVLAITGLLHPDTLLLLPPAPASTDSNTGHHPQQSGQGGGMSMSSNDVGGMTNKTTNSNKEGMSSSGLSSNDTGSGDKAPMTSSPAANMTMR
jgi:predicted metal-binding membrane protein